MNNPIPIIFLAFADGQKNLRYMLEEEKLIRDALRAAKQEGLCEIVVEHHTTLEKIIHVFQDPNYRNRIAIFHFAGHANDYSLLLENPFGEKDIIYSDGFSAYLGAQKSLQLVFLNACATLPQSQALHKHGIPIVIATAQKVADRQALDIACFFYKSLGAGNSLERAFREAKNLLDAKEQNSESEVRAIGLASNEFEEAASEKWVLVHPDQMEMAKKWNLPDAVNHPLFNLPLLTKCDYPSEPFPGLAAYHRDYAKVFFGRSYEIRDIHRALHDKDAPSVILYSGASGVGKTSLLQAGLLPRIPQSKILGYWTTTQAGELTLEQYLQEIIDSKSILSLTSRTFLFIDGPPHSADHYLFLLQKIGALSNHSIKILIAVRIGKLMDWTSKLTLAKLSFRTLFLHPISKAGIEEVIDRLSGLNHFYQLQIAPSLGAALANGLHRDSIAPITDLLQIILLHFWNKAKAIAHSNPNWPIEFYYELDTSGFWENFIEEQLQSIDKEAFHSGALLNVLASCLEWEGTSNQELFFRKMKDECELLDEDSHHFLPELINRRLLSEPSIDQVNTALKIRLNHRLLQIPLLHLLNHSSKLTQEARRLVRHHLDHNTLLEAKQLEVVVNAKIDRTQLRADEKRLLQQSAKAINIFQQKQSINQYRLTMLFILLTIGFFSNSTFLIFLILLILCYPNNTKLAQSNG